MQGIYKITIIATQQFYIGRSTNIVSRFKKHFSNFDSPIRLNHVSEIKLEVVEINEASTRFTLERQLLGLYSNDPKLLNREVYKQSTKPIPDLLWLDISDILVKLLGHIRYSRY